MEIVSVPVTKRRTWSRSVRIALHEGSPETEWKCSYAGRRLKRDGNFYQNTRRRNCTELHQSLHPEPDDLHPLIASRYGYRYVLRALLLGQECQYANSQTLHPILFFQGTWSWSPCEIWTINSNNEERLSAFWDVVLSKIVQKTMG